MSGDRLRDPATGEFFGKPMVIDARGLALVEGRMQSLAAVVDLVLAAAGARGWKFLLLAFEFRGGGSSYVSNLDRPGMIELARRFGNELRENQEPPGASFHPASSEDRLAGLLSPDQTLKLVAGQDEVAKLIREQLPAGWGFALIMVAPGGSASAYASDGARSDVAMALRESAIRWERHEDRPPGRLGKDS